MASMISLLVMTVALTATCKAETIASCGSQPYYPSQYTCYSGFLCPIIGGTPTLKCANACYLPSQYTCTNGLLSLAPPPATNDLFTIRALQTISDLQGKPIQACYQSFLVGPDASSCPYCPDAVARTGQCATFTNTTIIAGPSSLYVKVPGGQKIYVEPASNPTPGALRFTQANNPSLPSGASSALAVRELGRGERSYIYTGPGATALGGAQGSGWVACRLAAGSGVWKVFARIQGSSQNAAYVANGCVGLEIGVDGVGVGSGYGAYQFN